MNCKTLRELCSEAGLDARPWPSGHRSSVFSIHTLEPNPYDVVMDLLSTFLDQPYDSIEARDEVLYELTEELRGVDLRTGPGLPEARPGKPEPPKAGTWLVWKGIRWE